MALQDDCETPLWSIIMKSEGTLDTENSSFCFSEHDFHGSTISAITLDDDYLAPSPEVERKWTSESKVKETVRPPTKVGASRFSSCSDAGAGDATACQMPKRKLSGSFSGPLLDCDFTMISDCDSFSMTDDEESLDDTIDRTCGFEDDFVVSSKYHIDEAASIDASIALRDLFGH